MLNGFRCYTYNSKSGGEANLDIRRVQQGIMKRPGSDVSGADATQSIVSCRLSTATADEYLSPHITFAPAQGIRGRRVTAEGLPQVDSSWGAEHGDGGIKTKSKAGDKARHSPALHNLCPSPPHLHPPLLLLLHSTSTCHAPPSVLPRSLLVCPHEARALRATLSSERWES